LSSPSSTPGEIDLSKLRSLSILDQIEKHGSADVSFASRPALTDESGVFISYHELSLLLRKRELNEFLKEQKFFFIILSREINAVVLYLKLLESGASFLVLPEDSTRSSLDSLVLAYEPSAILGKKEALLNLGLASSREWRNYSVSDLQGSSKSDIRFSQQILMSTSGSTGSPKQVRLSPGHLAANAADIASALEISHEDSALTVLPLSYSYGLSVLNSHLWAGANIVLSNFGILSQGFLELIDRRGVTSLVGVPFTYQMYERLGILEYPPRGLRYFTQAGGALDAKTIFKVSNALNKNGVGFFPMYGQTEATARITIMKSENVSESPGSVGEVVKSGRLMIGSTNHPEELVFSGPNVMLGYSTGLKDLSLPDQLGGVLKTGDLASIQNGLVTIIGRIRRIAKINGMRINLLEIENQLSKIAAVAALESNNKLAIFAELEKGNLQDLEDSLVNLGIQKRDFFIERISQIPRLSSGKTDYEKLSGL
jgi:long-chain acyl-CoA synthetase